MVPPGLIVRNARVHPTTLHGAELRDVQVDGDAIAAIGPAGSIAADGRPELDADGRLLSPPLVDPHVHMDAALTVGEPRHNVSGTLIEGIQTWAERKPFLTHDDVKRRAREAIRWEVAQGTGLIRSHVDVCDPNLVALKALLELRDEVRDIVDLRLIAFPQDGILSLPGRQGAHARGDAPRLRHHRRHPALRVDPRRRRRGGPLPVRPGQGDRCADRPPLRRDRRRAEPLPRGRGRPGDARRDGGPGGRRPHHGDGRYNDAYAFKLLQILKRAGVTIVANPLDNIVLQGRFDTYPKRRGMTRVKELDAAGVNVACGHDSIMDPWYPLGRGSMLDALSMLVHVAQMTGRTELFRAYEMVTTNPARAAEVPYGVKEGMPANFVVFDCTDEAEAIRLRPPARWVVRLGRVVAETEPARSTVHHAGTSREVTFTIPPPTVGIVGGSGG